MSGWSGVHGRISPSFAGVFSSQAPYLYMVDMVNMV